MSVPVLAELRVAAEAAAWEAAGFAVQSQQAVVGGVGVRFTEGSGGLIDWVLTEVRVAGVDGLPTRLGSAPASSGGPHPNGVVEIDHVVVLTPRLERTVECFEAIGVKLRRIREGESGMGVAVRQAFFRVGKPILEVVEAKDMEPDAPARFWGITLTTRDIDGAARLLGDKLGQVKDAVQPGRRIATVRKEAGLGLPVALITPVLKA